MQVILTVTDGPHQGRGYTFAGLDTFIVGRAKCVPFRLPEKDKFFSRVHFMVEVNPPQCHLVDLGSRNGTLVNGKKVLTADLKDGDVIRGGKAVLRVSILPRESNDEGSHAAGQRLSDLPTADRTVSPAAKSTITFRPEDTGGHRSSGNVGHKQRTVACRICAAPVAAANLKATEPGKGDPLSPVPVCANCRREIESRPQSVPGYQIVRELGHGGMGVVYLALRPSDGELAAIKTILPAVAATRRDMDKFLREARILGELDHPNIVAFREMGQVDEQLYFVMEFVPGRDAANMLREEQRPLAIGRAMRLVSQMLQALDYAHAKGFVHRDIKPSNLLVTHEQGREVAKLSDFGLARTYHAARISGLTVMGHRGGTLECKAPVQLTNFRDVKPPVDIYSAGATLYTLLTGRFVYDFPDTTAHKIGMLLQQEPVPIQSRRDQIPQELAQIVHRAIARDPAARFADARSMRKALSPFVEMA